MTQVVKIDRLVNSYIVHIAKYMAYFAFSRLLWSGATPILDGILSPEVLTLPWDNLMVVLILITWLTHWIECNPHSSPVGGQEKMATARQNIYDDTNRAKSLFTLICGDYFKTLWFVIDDAHCLYSFVNDSSIEEDDRTSFACKRI